MNTTYEVIIIGGGQAGLAAGYHLKKQGIPFLILDRGTTVGEVWRKRYDSLVLFTPRSYSSLPGMPLQGESEGVPTKDEIADYLQAYAEAFDLPVQLQTEVESVELNSSYGFSIRTNQGELTARMVIVASGPFQCPGIPAFAAKLGNTVHQLHSSDYRRPQQLQPGPILVVGGGNSGAQIAIELGAYAKHNPVYLSVGEKPSFIPLTLWGRSVFTWLNKLGLLEVSGKSFLGSRLRRRPDPIFGKELKLALRQGMVAIKQRAVDAEQDRIYFADQSQISVANVVWATGFRPSFDFLQIPGALQADARPVHREGIGAVEGLYYVGMPWQRARGSALLGGVGRDAAYIVERIKDKLQGF